MMKASLAALMAMLFAFPALADHPATGYWFVEVARLTNEVTRAGSIDKVEDSVLDEVAECHGYFKGSTDLWLKVRTLQFRIVARDDGKIVDFSIKLFDSQVKANPKTSVGRVAVDTGAVAKPDWEKEKFVLVLKRLNLAQ